MSIDIKELLKTLGGQISEKAVENVKAANEQLTLRDREIIERAGERKAELLLARMLGQDVAADEVQIDETLALIAGKAGRIAKETVKNTFLDAVKVGATFVLKLAFGALIPT